MAETAEGWLSAGTINPHIDEANNRRNQERAIPIATTSPG
jgi:hypothetical protein